MLFSTLVTAFLQSIISTAPVKRHERSIAERNEILVTKNFDLFQVVCVSTQGNFLPRKNPLKCQWSDKNNYKTNGLMFNLLDLDF